MYAGDDAADDGQRALGNGPCYAHLRAGGSVLLPDGRHLAGQRLELWQHGVVLWVWQCRRTQFFLEINYLKNLHLLRIYCIFVSEL